MLGNTRKRRYDQLQPKAQARKQHQVTSLFLVASVSTFEQLKVLPLTQNQPSTEGWHRKMLLTLLLYKITKWKIASIGGRGLKWPASLIV